MAEGEVGEAGAAGLARASDHELRAAGVIRGLVALQPVAPGLHEKPLDEWGFGLPFGQRVASGPRAEAFQQGGGFGAGLEGLELRAPLGAEEGVV
jgi:hypothetical protein